MTSAFRPATRANAQLLIALWADSGAGKTRSGLAIARGIAAEPGEDFADPAALRKIDARIFVIDTDAGRAEHYAPAGGEDPRADRFAFQHAKLQPPFTFDRYLALCADAVANGAKVIMTDSISDLWNGKGGCSDQHEEEVAAAVERAHKRWQRGPKKYPFDPDWEAERVSLTAWKAPKMGWRRMERELLQLPAHLIFCGHADDKLRFGKDETGKTSVTAPADLPIAQRWEPIAEAKFKRRLVVSLVLAPDAPGMPHVHKQMDSELAACVPLDRQLNADVGLRLAAWSRGETSVRKTAQTSDNERPAAPNFGAAGAGQDGGDAETPPSASIPSDSFPGDLVDYAGARFDPARARKMPLGAQASEQSLIAFCKAFKLLVERCETDEAKRAWFARNSDALLIVSARKPLWHGALREIEPPPGGGATEGASADVEPGDAPSPSFDEDASYREMMR